ncbi:MAG: 50S ribosomal protein L37ae [Candidatus Micrarchaeota archaeon]|nr:50S ribosomal protein L37ae [Candidatus Micrarchaeota archaeon]
MADRNVRYGAEIRKRAEKVDAVRRSTFICPSCSKKKVKRKGNSLWACKSCGAVFAGGAFSLATPTGMVAARMIEEYKAKK